MEERELILASPLFAGLTAAEAGAALPCLGARRVRFTASPYQAPPAAIAAQTTVGMAWKWAYPNSSGSIQLW